MKEKEKRKKKEKEKEMKKMKKMTTKEKGRWNGMQQRQIGHDFWEELGRTRLWIFGGGTP